MNTVTAQAIVKKAVEEQAPTSMSDLLYRSVLLAVPTLDFKGIVLGQTSIDSINGTFNAALANATNGVYDVMQALVLIVAEYERCIDVEVAAKSEVDITLEQIKASVEAGVLSQETAERLASTIPSVEKKKGFDILGSIKSAGKGIKGAFDKVKAENQKAGNTYGKLDTAHAVVGKAINVVHGANNIAIDTTTVLGCGAVDLAAKLTKKGIITTGVVAKGVNNIGQTVGHKANDGAYEAGKTIMNTVRRERNMDLSELDNF